MAMPSEVQTPGRERYTVRRAMVLGSWIVPFLLFAAPLLLLSQKPPPFGSELLLDMEVGDASMSPTGFIEIYVNDTAQEPLRQVSLPAKRRNYRFNLAGFQDIRFLRLDPTNFPDIPVRLYGLRIVGQGETLCRFSAADLSRWWTNCEQASLEGDALVLRASHRDPILNATFGAIELPAEPDGTLWTALWRRLFGETGRPQLVLVLTLALGLVVCLGVLGRSGWPAALIVGASIPLTWGTLTLVGKLGSRPPVPTAAVGYACFAGYGTSLHMLEVALLILVPGLAALLYLGGRRLFCGPTLVWPEPDPSVGDQPRRRRLGHLTILLVVVGVAGYFFPNLALREGILAPSGGGWDGDNILVWQHLIQTGARPYRDFWYPYSGHGVRLLPFPCGEMLTAAHQTAVFVVLLLAVYLGTGKALGRTLAIFGTAFGLSVCGFCAAPERYGLLANVILSYVAIDQQQRKWQWAHVLFWIALIHAGVMEPASVIYAGIPLGMTVLAEAVSGGAAFWRGLPGRLGRELAVPLGVFAAIAASLAARGQLRGFLDFMLSLRTMAAYGASPFDLSLWLGWGSAVESFAMWSAVVLTALGLGCVVGWPTREQPISKGVLLLGLTSAFMLLKQFVRPHIGEQMLILPTVGIALYLFGGLRQCTALQRCAVYGIGGVLLALGFASHTIERVAGHVAHFGSRLTGSLPSLAMSHQERKALVKERFAPEHFRLSKGHQAVVRTLTERFAREGKQPFFVLSDDPVFYLLLGTRPYFHVNFYNACPIEEQQHMLRLLDKTPPTVVVWRPSDVGMDHVPPVVRAPLVFDHVIRNYVPLTTHGQFELLRRRLPGEAVALDFWMTRLGSTVNLGHIPRFSSIRRFQKVAPDSDRACEFLSIWVADPAALAMSPPPGQLPTIPVITPCYHPTGRPLGIPVEAGGKHFTIALYVVPGQVDYHVRLDRVWFWRALQEAGLSPKIGNVERGVEVKVIRRARRDDILY